jgi:hypothetical protein
MDIKRKTCDIRTWGENVSSTNIDTLVKFEVSTAVTMMIIISQKMIIIIDTLVSSLYQCVKTRSVEVL